METTKRPALIALARVMAETRTPYAIIGGIALQAHRTDPRSTADIDVVVIEIDRLPRQELEAAGFQLGGRFTFSENWVGPEGVPVQFTDDPPLLPALERAIEIPLDDDAPPLRVIGRADLLHSKLRAGSDPARRRSKRHQDLVDAEMLLEDAPELRAELTEAEKAIIDSLPE